LAANPVRRIQDVIGKRIGLDPSGKATLDVALANAGLPRDYTVVNVSGDPQPLVDGQVDAMAVFVTSQPITLDQRGVANVAVTFNDLGFPSYENVLIARRETVENDEDLLTRYLRAVIKGWELNRRTRRQVPRRPSTSTVRTTRLISPSRSRRTNSRCR
jgi:NitT/TauT family transport system substrate-binding protein